jgi:hypothetical protein
MPESLIRAKIKEALVATGHNRHDAHKLLLTWAVRDPALLLAMTKPHLKAIAAGHIDHFLRQTTDADSDEGAENFSRTAIDDIVASAGLRQSGDKRRNTVVPPPKSTERQASTMRKLAAAFTRKKK